MGKLTPEQTKAIVEILSLLELLETGCLLNDERIKGCWSNLIAIKREYL